MSNRVVYRKKRQNKLSMFLVCGVVLLLMMVVYIKSNDLRARIADYSAKETQLLRQIKDEENRRDDIEAYRVYTQTKAFYEEVAKDKLGLVYEGEIIFKQE